jgi:hypothetical protein
MRAGSDRISVPLIRDAAKSWFLTDKEKALESRDQARSLLNWIIEKVIREKRARAFLVSEEHSHDPLLLALFDARVLHVVRCGYSAQDRPGERYEVWVIDYGAHVDLVQTKYAAQGDLPIGSEGEGGYNSIDVPKQDLRAIRRAILDLDTFSTEDSGRQSLTFR